MACRLASHYFLWTDSALCAVAIFTVRGYNYKSCSDVIWRKIMETININKGIKPLSIIVPVYNVKDYVAKCLDSILAQTYKDFELLVIDDGSTDGSGKICDNYGEKDSRVRVIHQKNAGLGGARNTGIGLALGEYLLFVDSDDYIEPNTAEVLLNTAKLNSADMVLFSFRSVDENGSEMAVFSESLTANTVLSTEKDKECLIVAPTACTKLYRRDLFTKADIIFPPRVWYEDLRTTYKLLSCSKKVVYINNVLYNYLIRSGSIMQNSNIERNSEIIDAFEDLLGYFKETNKFEAFKQELEYLCIYHLYITASVRVIRADSKHELIGKFRSFIEANFPNYRNNHYLSRLSKNQKIVYKLMNRKMYGIIKLIFKIKSI